MLASELEMLVACARETMAASVAAESQCSPAKQARAVALRLFPPGGEAAPAAGAAPAGAPAGGDGARAAARPNSKRLKAPGAAKKAAAVARADKGPVAPADAAPAAPAAPAAAPQVARPVAHAADVEAPPAAARVAKPRGSKVKKLGVAARRPSIPQVTRRPSIPQVATPVPEPALAPAATATDDAKGGDGAKHADQRGWAAEFELRCSSMESRFEARLAALEARIGEGSDASEARGVGARLDALEARAAAADGAAAAAGAPTDASQPPSPSGPAPRPSPPPTRTPQPTRTPPQSASKPAASPAGAAKAAAGAAKSPGAKRLAAPAGMRPPATPPGAEAPRVRPGERAPEAAAQELFRDARPSSPHSLQASSSYLYGDDARLREDGVGSPKEESEERISVGPLPLPARELLTIDVEFLAPAPKPAPKPAVKPAAKAAAKAAAAAATAARPAWTTVAGAQAAAVAAATAATKPIWAASAAEETSPVKQLFDRNNASSSAAERASPRRASLRMFRSASLPSPLRSRSKSLPPGASPGGEAKAAKARAAAALKVDLDSLARAHALVRNWPRSPPPPPTTRVPGDEPTIQRAIDSTPPGGRIVVSPGVYREALVVDHAVELVGEAFAVGAEPTVVVEAPETSQRALLVTPTGICCARNMIFRCAPCAASRPCAAVGVKGGTLELVACFVGSAEALSGVNAQRGATLRLRDVVAAGCRHTGALVSGRGTRAEIDGGALRGNGAHGLEVQDGAAVDARDVELRDNALFGSFVSDQGSVLTLTRADLHSNKRCGVWVQSGASAYLAHTTIFDSSQHGLAVSEGASTAELIECDMRGNTSNFAFLNGAAPSSITTVGCRLVEAAPETEALAADPGAE